MASRRLDRREAAPAFDENGVFWYNDFTFLGQ